jgi:signal transduction histidine kinase
MRLASKLTVALLVGILVWIGANDYAAIEDDIHDFETHIGDDLSLMARGLSIALAELARVSGESAAQRLIAERNQEGNAQVRWIVLDAGRGDVRWADLDVREKAALRANLEVRLVRGRGARDERLFVYRAFRLESPVRDVIELSESLAPVRERAHRSMIRIAVKSVLILLLAALYALALGAWFVGRPIEKLIALARRVGGGDLSQRLAPSHDDEIGELATELNTMCDRLDEAGRRVATEMAAKLAAVEQLRHADRLKTVGQLASGIAHELGTPLNVVAGHAKMIAAPEATREESLDSARVIAEQSVRMTAIIRQLLDFARRGRPTLRVGNLEEVVQRTVRMLAHLAAQREVTIVVGQGSARVKMDEAQVQQALTNLVLNGIQAMPGGGHLRIAMARTRAQASDGVEGDYARISVADEGAGIAAEDLPRVFEPFFTTKDVGEGTGLGLSVSHGIVHEHGGWIAVETQSGKGSCFSLFLPVAP